MHISAHRTRVLAVTGCCLFVVMLLSVSRASPERLLCAVTSGPNLFLFIQVFPCISPQLPPEDVKEFLEHVAVPRINRGWEFLLPTDEDFIRKHPDVAHRQNMLWLGIQSK